MAETRQSVFRYCQILLKSIPATLDLAESISIDKSLILAELPTFVGNLESWPDKKKLISCIIKQINLAHKIQKHLVFFKKTNETMQLHLPLVIRNDLLASVNILDEYVDLLGKQMVALGDNDLSSFFRQIAAEQGLDVKINSLFKKPVFALPDKPQPFEEVKSLLNSVFFSAKSFLSPLVKAMHVIFLSIVLSLPALVYGKDPVLIPKQATEIVAPPIQDLDKVSKELIAAGWPVKQIIKARKAGRPTIIIKEDVHGNPSEEAKFLVHVKRNYGLNLVALEGWAGQEQDQKRGYTLLNAEEDLISLLADYDTFYKIGLEHAPLQEFTLEMVGLICVLNLQIGTTNLSILKNRLKETEGLLAEAKKKIKSGKAEVMLDFLEAELAKLRAKIIESEKLIKTSSDSISYICSKLGISASQLKEKHKAILEKPLNEAKQVCDSFIVDVRSALAAKKIAEAMVDKKSIVVIMGAGHTESVIKALVGSDFNIIIVGYIEEE